jgi:Holliday junction resolvasome RuvABC endonuclease subunit
MIAGLDFSINSTALAIKIGDTPLLFSFVPNYKSGKAAFKVHDALKGIVTTIGYTKEASSKDSLEDQCIKLRNADNLSNEIITIFDLLSLENPITEIRIEGFSYASKGNSFIDLIMFNTFLKVKLIQKFGHIIKVVPPKTLKKAYTGNGNASKCDMVRHYMNSSNEKLQQKILEMNIVKEDDFVIPKPIDDICDAIGLTSIWE